MSDKPEHIGLDSKPLTEKDRIDLGHEQSGQNVGRIQRFLTQNDTDLYGETSEKKKQDRATNMLMYMLQNDPLYAAAYRQLENTLNDAQQAVDTALLDIKQRLAESVETLQKMEDNAGELEDGTKVFRDSLGNMVTENGKVLSAQEAQNIHIPEGAPSWEEYNAEKQRRADLLREREELERYQRNVLDDVRRRMQDKENPMTREELEDEDRRVRKLVPPEAKRFFTSSETSGIEAEAPKSASFAEGMDEKKGLTEIELTDAFSKVNSEEPDLSIFDAPDRAPATTPSPV